MPYQYRGWTLYALEVEAPGGTVTIYFFNRKTPKEGKPMDALPSGMEPALDKGTGLPILVESKRIRELREVTPFQFQDLICEKLSARKTGGGGRDMGVDGWLPDGRPLQVKQSEGVSRPVVDGFETAVLRDGKRRGLIVAFSFSKGAYEEADRARTKGGPDIELRTVAELFTE